MASTEAAAAAIPVAEVAAMNDAQLAELLQKKRLPDGNYHLPVDGWDQLSKDDRGRLAERLETQKRSLAPSPTTCPRPLDLDDLDARLRQVSPNTSFSLRPEPEQAVDGPDPPTPPIDPTRDEIDAYHELVDDGGRPSYPVHLIQDVYANPDDYAEVLRPWQESLTETWAENIFQRQLQRWKDFRQWQNDNRGREDDDGGFPAYVELKKRWIKRDFREEWAAKLLAEIEADPSGLKSRWDQRQSLRMRKRRLCREHGCRGFRDYAEAVKRRLADHGLTRPTELDEDPKEQDKLTTWMEYLNHEYWWLDKYTSDIERLEPEHDKLWQELVDEGIPRSHETKEFVRTLESPLERQAEDDQATKMVQQAESEAKRIYASTQEDPERLLIPQAERMSMMKHGTDKLLAARRRLEQIRDRNSRITGFIRATFGYDRAKRDAARHRVLVRWVLDQVPLIEAETNLSKGSSGPVPGGGKRTKRSLSTDGVSSGGREPKRARFDLEEPRRASARVLSRATETHPEARDVMGGEATEDWQPENLAAGGSHQNEVQATSQGPRRSARIAARREAMAPQPDISQPRPRSRAGAAPEHPRKPRPRVQGTKAHKTTEQPRNDEAKLPRGR